LAIFFLLPLPGFAETGKDGFVEEGSAPVYANATENAGAICNLFRAGHDTYGNNLYELEVGDKTEPEQMHCREALNLYKREGCSKSVSPLPDCDTDFND
jgi:hypothetical protein